ncbi:hypothetical protein JZ751_001140 [Albula glossodonta]|uniref:Sodium/calcium exchanger membrane region domain-containing protein n=1 Tax=Albula glossodonta TaxID=121402 RepID=A0A8T2PT05_9TELE|nr:hypothetical protein JZ751_001140 [Albula glossodonta]
MGRDDRPKGMGIKKEEKWAKDRALRNSCRKWIGRPERSNQMVVRDLNICQGSQGDIIVNRAESCCVEALVSFSQPCRQQEVEKKALVPWEVLLLLTVPVVDPDKEDRNWKRPLNCLHLQQPVDSYRVLTDGLHYIEGEFPVWALTLISGLFLSIIIFCTTTNEQPPRYHFVFSLMGFIVSAMWISTAASEVVSLLHTLGVVFSLSNTVLGLTLLAWGNSIGDMLFGVGLGCLVQLFNQHNVVTLEAAGLLEWVLAGGLGLSLVLSFVLVPLQCFHLGRTYGIVLLLVYAIFLLVALLTEFGMIHIGGV